MNPGIGSSIFLGYFSSLAGLLHAEGARAEPYTLENLVTHRSEKIWLSRLSVREYLEK